MAQSINNLAINSLIKFGSIYGKPIVWRIADKNHDGYPSNSVTLVSDQIIKMLLFDAKEKQNSSDTRKAYGNSRYVYSNLRQWLNSAAEAGAWYTPQHSADAAPSPSNIGDSWNAYDSDAGFLNGFTAEERAALLDTTIDVGRCKKDAGGAEVCIDKVFPMSCTEAGLLGYVTCGSKLAIFSYDTSRVATVTADCVAHSNYPQNPASGSAWYYLLRDAYPELDYGVMMVKKNGDKDWQYAYFGNVGLRPACNISGDLMVADSTDSDGCYSVVFNTAPTAPASITLPTQISGGKSAEISWGAATDPDGNLSGYVLEQIVDSGDWTQIYKGSARSYSAPITYGSQTVQFRVKAYDEAGAESTYTTSAVRYVTNNRDPVISGKDGDLGNFTVTGPIHSYTVTDEDGHEVTVVEKLDDTTIKSYTATLGQINNLTVDDATWRKVLNGSHTLTITATDAMGASVTRTMTFTKIVTSVEFEQTMAMAADDMPTKALVNIQGYFPAGCTLIVLICNNGNDASPTWEDITSQARSGQKFYFANTTKTASTWGVKLKVSLLKGSATETCYIQSLGGNFA